VKIEDISFLLHLFQDGNIKMLKEAAAISNSIVYYYCSFYDFEQPDFSRMESTAKHIQIEKVQQIDNNYDICIFFLI